MMPFAAILAALKGQRERVTWVILGMVAAYYLLTYGMEIGELKSDNKWATATIQQLTETVSKLEDKCGG